MGFAKKLSSVFTEKQNKKNETGLFEIEYQAERKKHQYGEGRI